MTTDEPAIPIDYAAIAALHRPLREKQMTEGFVSREAISEGFISLDELKAGPWECDVITGYWHRRTAEFMDRRAEIRRDLPQQQKDAEIALASAMIALEPDLPPQKDYDFKGATAPNGQPYVTMTWNIINEDPDAKGWDTSADAITALKRAIVKHAAAQQGDILWWRNRPEIEGVFAFGEVMPRWIIYARLLIGNKSDIVSSETPAA
jgi:hypothetical protein